MKKQNQNEPQRILYYEAAFAVENLNLNVTHYGILIGRTFKAWNEINSTPLTLQELQDILKSEKKPEFIENLLCERLLAGKKVEVLGFPVNKENLKSLIALPEIHEVLVCIENFKKAPTYKTHFNVTRDIQWHLYEIENGQITINAEAMELQEDRDWREYATEPHELKNLSEVLPLCNALNKLIRDNPNVNQNFIDLDSLLFLNYDGLYVPSSNFIKTGQCIGHVQILPAITKAPTTPNILAANFEKIPTITKPTPPELTPEAAETAEKKAAELTAAAEGVKAWSAKEKAMGR